MWREGRVVLAYELPNIASQGLSNTDTFTCCSAERNSERFIWSLGRPFVKPLFKQNQLFLLLTYL